MHSQCACSHSARHTQLLARRHPPLLAKFLDSIRMRRLLDKGIGLVPRPTAGMESPVLSLKCVGGVILVADDRLL